MDAIYYTFLLVSKITTATTIVYAKHFVLLPPANHIEPIETYNHLHPVYTVYYQSSCLKSSQPQLQLHPLEQEGHHRSNESILNPHSPPSGIKWPALYHPMAELMMVHPLLLSEQDGPA
jgi:hypothetical protein